ncbi:long-chain-fatty-acid--CoA ligase [Pseudomonas sp. JQ170]|uniref:long-chain-fatty-acid--CoA ligase n=1 Tax=unclassified Pseudomonas TaxID=196821 RepID=UPI0026557367|nr:MULTISPECIES: long-chain-fatty-acid--CoA ligase [unclassified Pseudomonas]MDN7139851.1 long-chain-fatty-acid--CoA ligase [Pseudomonas sp. JQ170]WRO73695.1 long-chain-fatty-acid--CoA ligase [Pseudomonas sp. 170C]
MYITQGLHRHLQRCPQATAIETQDRSMTYAQFGDRVARLAGALKNLGVASGERVAMLSLNSHRYIEYYQAVPWADAVLNPVNIRWSVAEIVYSLDDSDTSVLIVDNNFIALAGHIIAAAKTLRTVIYAGDGETPDGMLNYEALIAQSAPVADARRHGDALLGIFYTGGTTGFPKGVMLSHNNVCASSLALVAANSCRAQERYLHVMPMFHLADFAAMTALFISGGTHLLLPSFNPQNVLQMIASQRISELLLAPTMIQMLLDWRDNHPDAAALDLSSLQIIGYGASPITPALLKRTREAFPAAGLRQGYGMTELAPMATLLLPQYHSEEHHHSGKMYSAGLPAMCVEVRIVDGDDVEVPRGTVGEIVVRGPNVMLGYWNKPEATAEAIRDGWMHTGDGGFMDEDGFVHVCDRLKDMIVSGGENIYSAEVETAIASHPAVAQVAVIGIPCKKWGETVHAVIIRKADADVADVEIVAHCRERIAGYKCPRSVEFRDSLPLSSVGKVLKTDLRAPFWEGRKRGVA